MNYREMQPKDMPAVFKVRTRQLGWKPTGEFRKGEQVLKLTKE